MASLPARKGYRRIADIPAPVLRDLNRGKIEAVSLAECLAVDLSQLMRNAFPQAHKKTVAAMAAAKETGWVGRTRLAGELLLQDLGLQTLEETRNHASDQVRGWGAAVIAAAEGLSLKKRLSLVRAVADDPNAGVRETAWIMLRPHVAQDLDEAFALLQPWTRETSANLRRYACEITRPRGVWCAYLPSLRKDPSAGLPLLSELRADPARYVQNSVANWLNDASKDSPHWVETLTRKWEKSSTSKETSYIVRRARRTLARDAY